MTDHNIDAEPFRRPHDPVPDPTPQQIAERAAKIRAGWDEETRQARLRGWPCGTEEDRKAGQRAEAMARAALL